MMAGAGMTAEPRALQDTRSTSIIRERMYTQPWVSFCYFGVGKAFHNFTVIKVGTAS